MPRSARTKSETGIYHVMLRGIHQTQLFYDDDDRQQLLRRIERYKSECGFFLYAYCLMANHVHLLIQEQEVQLCQIIKRLAISYAHFFNAKYDRSGYLFQGRFKSEAVESESYLRSPKSAWQTPRPSSLSNTSEALPTAHSWRSWKGPRAMRHSGFLRKGGCPYGSSPG